MNPNEYGDINPYIDELETSLTSERNKNLQLSNAQIGNFSQPGEDNLIRYQLDLIEVVDRIKHLLRGDIESEDKDGNITYQPNNNDEEKTFNDYGVKKIMNIISFSINRNTLLSNFDNETINWKCEDFGNRISDLILCEFSKMMLTTSFEKEFEKEYGVKCEKLPDNVYVVEMKDRWGQVYHQYLDKDIIMKINLRIAEHLLHKAETYPLIVDELVDSYHASLLRALAGGERESLRTARVVSQSENIGKQLNQQMQSQQSKFSLIKPSTWIR